jgi:murein L,D-transpeptidase YafK
MLKGIREKFLTITTLLFFSITSGSAGPIIRIEELINYDKKLEEIVDSNSKDKVMLVISKEDHLAYFVQNGKILKSYPIAMSPNYMNDKKREGDMGVPEGVYYITSKASGNTFYKFSPLNYPNEEDAEEALREGIIDKNEYRIIVNANRKKAPFIPPTRAGSAIGLHGSSCKKENCLGVGEFEDNAFDIIDWTLGCIAFNNFDWNEIIKYIKPWNTPVYITKKIKPEEIKNLYKRFMQR